MKFFEQGFKVAFVNSSIISFLANMGHICIPILVLPSIEESAKVCENAFNFIAEISQIHNIGSMFLIDNSTNEDKFAINNKFIKDFVSFVEINNNSTISNIDTREKKLLLETPGISIIGRSSKTKSSSIDIIESESFCIVKKIMAVVCYYHRYLIIYDIPLEPNPPRLTLLRCSTL